MSFKKILHASRDALPTHIRFQLPFPLLQHTCHIDDIYLHVLHAIHIQRSERSLQKQCELVSASKELLGQRQPGNPYSFKIIIRCIHLLSIY